MARKLIVNTKCYLCGNEVYYKDPAENENSEWIQTKRGLKQFLHTNCWTEMIEKQKAEAKELVNA